MHAFDMYHDHLYLLQPGIEQSNYLHTLTAPRTTAAFTCWNCGMTLSQICSLSLSSTALYLASVVRIAILPHSEHSLSATRSFVSVGWSITKSDDAGRLEGGGVDPPGEEGGEEGWFSEASCMSPSAATAFATTCRKPSRLKGLPSGSHPQSSPAKSR